MEFGASVLMARYNEGLGFRGSQDWVFLIRECRASECLGFSGSGLLGLEVLSYCKDPVGICGD